MFIRENRFVITCLLCLSFLYAGARSNYYYSTGARFVGVGQASVAMSDHWSPHSNVAGGAALTQFGAGFFYDRRFSMAGFDVLAASVHQPTKYGVGMGAMYRFGDELYNQTKMSVGWAHQIKGVSLGISTDYIQTSIQDFGQKSNLAFNFGGIATIVPTLKFGACVYNINQARLSGYDDERIPTIMKAGAQYNPHKGLYVMGEIEKDVEQRERYKVGLEYAIIESVQLRSGINLNPQVLFFGIGAQNQVLSLDYATSFQMPLGFVHAMSVQYKMPKKKSKTPADLQIAP